MNLNKKSIVFTEIVVLLLIVLFYNQIFTSVGNTYNYFKDVFKNEQGQQVIDYSTSPIKVISKEKVNYLYLINIQIVNDNHELEIKTIKVDDQVVWESILINKTYSIEYTEPLAEGEMPYLDNIELQTHISFEEFYEQSKKYR